MNWRPGEKTVGVLGGGQLARLLVLAGHRVGIPVAVLSQSERDPAAQVTRHWMAGDPRQEADLLRFAKGVDVLTFESEFFDGDLLRRVGQKTGKPIAPNPGTLGSLQDRALQKDLLVRQRIPTARYISADRIEDAQDLKEAFELFPQGFVLKTRRFGYDGYGTFFVDPRQRNRFDKQLLERLSRIETGFIIEERIQFQRELAIICVRSQNGETIHLPLVETFQQNGVCHWVKGPAKLSTLGSMRLRLKRFLKDLDYLGVLAFELFQTQKGWLVNELAPRVHNSGHYSLDALVTDQFALHLQAILGQPLGGVEPRSKGFAMVNLLGRSERPPAWPLPVKGASLHWYFKSENRPGRKLGHLNALAASPDEALRVALRAAKRFKL